LGRDPGIWYKWGVTPDQDPSAGPGEPLVELQDPLADDRGDIRLLLERPMGSAVLIRSLKGTVRANHYHRTDWHYCYLLKGSMEYHYRPAASKEPPRRLLARAGQMVFTPPLVEHAMAFPEETEFLVLSRNPRDQEAYEADVVRTRVL
jgi:quercetin dioxygenase-like cupin family protein